MRPRSYLLLGILLWVGSVSLAAEPKRDRYGDPLPEGAVMRLGSLRLRNEAPILTAAFTPDGKTLAACDANSISFWDAATGKMARARRTQNRQSGTTAAPQRRRQYANHLWFR